MSDWYERMREHNPWLPPADKVLEAEVRYDPYRATMDLRVPVVMPVAGGAVSNWRLDKAMNHLGAARDEIATALRYLDRLEKDLEER